MKTLASICLILALSTFSYAEKKACAWIMWNRAYYPGSFTRWAADAGFQSTDDCVKALIDIIRENKKKKNQILKTVQIKKRNQKKVLVINGSILMKF